MIDWEDSTAADFLAGWRYFPRLAGDDDPSLPQMPRAPACEAPFAPSLVYAYGAEEADCVPSR